MIYVFFSLFCIFLIFDSMYIYYLLDKRILLSTSGSKINFLSENKSKQKKINLLSDYKGLLVRIIVSIILFISFYLFNKLIFSNTLNSNFIPITLFGKTTDVISLFNNQWKVLITLYYISLSIFLAIAIIYLDKHILKKHVSMFFNDKTKVLKKEDPKVLKERIKLGKDGLGNDVYISQEALYQNLCITGSIGSGKTSGAILNISRQLIRNNLGGVVLDIKGNLADKIERICTKEHRLEDLKIISLTSTACFNLIPNNTTSLETASMLKQVISLLSPTNNTDTYWLDKVENVLQNLFIIIEYYNKKKEIMELHRLVTNSDYLLEKIVLCKEELLKGDRNRKDYV